MRNKIEVIISDLRFLEKTINLFFGEKNNIPIVTVDTKNIHKLKEFPKIDLLIIDTPFQNEYNLQYVKRIINLTNFSFRDDEIKISKPCKAEYLLKAIQNVRSKTYLFCVINKSWIYDEQNSSLSHNKKTIKFTEKENQIFVEVLQANDFKLTKNEIMSRVWSYYNTIAETTTLEIHLHKLKQKLPKDFMWTEGENLGFKILSID